MLYTLLTLMLNKMLKKLLFKPKTYRYCFSENYKAFFVDLPTGIDKSCLYPAYHSHSLIHRSVHFIASWILCGYFYTLFCSKWVKGCLS
jgi:hypothetical protein